MDAAPYAEDSGDRRPRHLWLRRIIGAAIVLAAVVAIVAVTSLVLVRGRAIGHVSSSPDKVGATGRHAALVLGAGLDPDGTPSRLLVQRLDAAAKLHAAGRARVLILSGDNQVHGYNEPMAMYRYLRSKDVPATSLVPDYAGRRTYDSCWRARHVFGLRDVTIVTSHFHTARSVYTCRALGVTADALSAPERNFSLRSREPWYVREWIASVRAVSDAHLRSPAVVGGAHIDPFVPCSVWQAMDAADRPARPPVKGCRAARA